MSDSTDLPPGTTLVDLIDMLAEPPEPPPIPLTPETAGWWVLGALLLTALAWGGWRAWGAWRANAYRRVALSELRRAHTGAEVAAILRRAALAAFPRRDVASLSGEGWLDFLHQTGRFPVQAGAALTRAPYAPEPADPEALRKAAAEWVRHHKRTGQGLGA